MFSEIFHLRCIGCGGECEDGVPVCPECLKHLETYQHMCETCGYPLQTAAKVCGQCLSGSPWDRIFINYRYKGALKTLLRQIKFGYRITGSKLLKEIIDTSHLGGYDLIISVPSHYTRRYRRFSHPAVTIAKYLSKITGTPYSKALLRTRKTEYQYKLKKNMRMLNVKGAFSCKSDLRGLKILLVDDIITTGSTIKECVKVLRRAGASSVDIYVLSGGHCG